MGPLAVAKVSGRRDLAVVVQNFTIAGDGITAASGKGIAVSNLHSIARSA
jgi:hypothetical protein